MTSPDWLTVTSGAAPLIVSLPHTGTVLPPDVASRVVSPWLARKDADWWIDRLYAFAADLDANGRPELYTTSVRGLERWTGDADGTMRADLLAPLVRDTAQRAQLALADIDGDGAFEVLVASARTSRMSSATPARRPGRRSRT